MPSVSFGLSLRGQFNNSTYYPTKLFTASEQGVWYDSSDLTTLFQDSAGTTPVTAPNQQVGLMLDKSQGLVLGSELVVNGNPFVAASWTTSNECSISGGVINCTTVAGANAQAYQGIASYSTSKAYQITINVTALTGTLQIIASTSTYTISITTVGIKVFTLRPTATDYPYITARFLTGASGSISSISLKEIAGNHAYQTTSTQRPIYGINPITGTRNLLTYTEQFNNAAWGKSSATVNANAVTAPDDTLTAEKLVETNGVTRGRINQSIATSVGNTLSVYAKAAEWNRVSIGISNGGGLWGLATFNLSTGLVDGGATYGGSSVDTATIVSVGKGWYRCSVRVASGTENPVIMPFNQSGDPVNPSPALTGDGTSGVYIWGAQLELGSTATAYQKVVSQYEVTQAGVQSASYIAFDGVDDNMVTGTITPATDKVQVFAGVRQLSNSNYGGLVSFGPTVNDQGTFLTWLRSSGGGGQFEAYARGASSATTGSVTGNLALTVPATSVFSTLYDVAQSSVTDEIQVRQNSIAMSVTGTSSAGTGNFSSQTMNIGQYNSSNKFNGRIYSLIVRFGANLTTGQITATESWVNGKTGAY